MTTIVSFMICNYSRKHIVVLIVVILIRTQLCAVCTSRITRQIYQPVWLRSRTKVFALRLFQSSFTVALNATRTLRFCSILQMTSDKDLLEFDTNKRRVLYLTLVRSIFELGSDQTFGLMSPDYYHPRSFVKAQFGFPPTYWGVLYNQNCCFTVYMRKIKIKLFVYLT